MVMKLLRVQYTLCKAATVYLAQKIFEKQLFG